MVGRNILIVRIIQKPLPGPTDSTWNEPPTHFFATLGPRIAAVEDDFARR
jgi:hypothetical protein